MTGRLSRVCRCGGFAAVLLFALRAAGDERLVLPGVARANGVGASRFVSTAWLHNPSDSQLAVDLALVAATGPAGTALLVLGPRQTLRVDDPVGSLFGLDSAAGCLTARADRPFLLGHETWMRQPFTGSIRTLGASLLRTPLFNP